jgi:hypothetical protein
MIVALLDNMKLPVAMLLAACALLAPRPVLAHPACGDSIEAVEAVENWSDARSDAGTQLLDEEHKYREAFRLLVEAADALNDCASAIVDVHTQAGVDAGNTDEAALRSMWTDTNYGMVATGYGRAAEAAIKLRDLAGCREMFALADVAWRKRNDAKSLGLDLAKNLRKCR